MIQAFHSLHCLFFCPQQLFLWIVRNLNISFNKILPGTNTCQDGINFWLFFPLMLLKEHFLFFHLLFHFFHLLRRLVVSRSHNILFRLIILDVKKVIWYLLNDVLCIIIKSKICQQGQNNSFIKSVDRSTIPIYHYTKIPKEVVS